MACQYGHDGDATAPRRERVRLAAADHHQPKPEVALQFSDAGQRRRDAPVGRLATVRGRHHPQHVGPRRNSVRADRFAADRAGEGDHAPGRTRYLRRLRDRRRRRSIADGWHALRRQAPYGEKNVGDDHEHASDGEGVTEESVAMGYVMRDGRRIEVGTLDAGIKPGKKRRPSFEYRWVKLPRHWITGLARTRSAATYRLAHIILIEAFKRKQNGGKIVLSAKVTGDMSRATRIRAALELVEFGLIKIEREEGKATKVSYILL